MKRSLLVVMLLVLSFSFLVLYLEQSLALVAEGSDDISNGDIQSKVTDEGIVIPHLIQGDEKLGDMSPEELAEYQKKLTEEREKRRKIREEVRKEVMNTKREMVEGYKDDIEELREEYKEDARELYKKAADLVEKLNSDELSDEEKEEIKNELKELRKEHKELVKEYRDEAKEIRVEYKDNLKEYLQETGKKYKLSNGREVEVKVMPEVASKRAIERLKLKACNEENGCSIDFKEVGKGDKKRLVYSLRAKKPGRFLGIFKVHMEVESEVDPETGEVIKARKPWWAILVNE